MAKEKEISYESISALIADVLNQNISKTRLISNDDLCMLIRHCLLTEHITISKAASLFGVSVSTMREVAMGWNLKIEIGKDYE